MVGWWSCRTSNGGMVKLWNRRIADWWNGGAVESSNGGMVELSNRRIVDLVG